MVVGVVLLFVANQGYCLVEFEKKEEAQLAIDEMDGSQLLEQDISVTWAFVKGGAFLFCFDFFVCLYFVPWFTLSAARSF